MNAYQQLAQLQHQLYHCDSISALLFTLVNQSRQVVPYQQAVLLHKNRVRQQWQVTALSNLPNVDRATPFVQWHETLINSLGSNYTEPTILTPQNIPAPLIEQWSTLSKQFLLYVPINEEYGLLVGNDTPLQELATELFQHIAEAFSHRIDALENTHTRWRLRNIKPVSVTILLSLMAAMLFPVSLSTIAPCEIIPYKPYVVTAPFNAVVEQVEVVPNQSITSDTALVSLEQDDLNNELNIARRKLAVSKAQLLKIRQASFVDPQAKAKLAELEAEVALQEEHVAHAEYRLERSRLHAPHSGIVIIDEVEQWRGRPVETGEAILKVANPDQVRVEILLPVSDAINLQPESPVKLFLDIAPLSPIDAAIEYAAYEPVVTPNGTIAYHVVAQLDTTHPPPRIGLQGSAKVIGEEVTLFYYLFRRPITALRQWLGW